MVHWAATRSLPARNRRRRRARPRRPRGPRRCTGSRRSPSPCSQASTRWLLIVAAGLYASNGAGRFQERYLFSILPLIPLGFGLFLRHGRPARVAVLAHLRGARPGRHACPALGLRSQHRLERLTVALGGGAAEHLVSLGTSSLLVAVYVAIGGALAAPGRVRPPSTRGLRRNDRLPGRRLHRSDVGRPVERAGQPRPVRLRQPDMGRRRKVGNVTAVATPLATPGLLTEQLYWNRSIAHEVVLTGAEPTDAFEAPPVKVAGDGTLVTPAGPLRTPILFEQFGATARLPAGNARRRDVELCALEAEERCTPRLARNRPLPRRLARALRCRHAVAASRGSDFEASSPSSSRCRSGSSRPPSRSGGGGRRSGLEPRRASGSASTSTGPGRARTRAVRGSSPTSGWSP